MKSLKPYEHINIPNQNGEVYCREEHKILRLDFDRCGKCRLLSGSAQGNGVECYYEDTYNGGNVTPDSELARVDSLIDYSVVPRYAVRPDQCDTQTNKQPLSNGKRRFKNEPYIHDDTVCCRFVLGKYDGRPMYCFG